MVQEPKKVSLEDKCKLECLQLPKLGENSSEIKQQSESVAHSVSEVSEATGSAVGNQRASINIQLELK